MDDTAKRDRELASALRTELKQLQPTFGSNAPVAIEKTSDLRVIRTAFNHIVAAMEAAGYMESGAVLHHAMRNLGDG